MKLHSLADNGILIALVFGYAARSYNNDYYHTKRLLANGSDLRILVSSGLQRMSYLCKFIMHPELDAKSLRISPLDHCTEMHNISSNLAE